MSDKIRVYLEQAAGIEMIPKQQLHPTQSPWRVLGG